MTKAIPSVIGPELYLPANVFAIKPTYLYRQVMQSELLSGSLSVHVFTVCLEAAGPVVCMLVKCQCCWVRGPGRISALVPHESASSTRHDTLLLHWHLLQLLETISSSSPTYCWILPATKHQLFYSPLPSNAHSLAKMSSVANRIRGGFEPLLFSTGNITLKTWLESELTVIIDTH